mmetsp:Transcript_13288/g.12888  ORF Transcript_13288/g.12888 Transcript_13288/m.12888 type:complete len:224 (+) Transcript_13288:871-1542(+)
MIIVFLHLFFQMRTILSFYFWSVIVVIVISMFSSRPIVFMNTFLIYSSHMARFSFFVNPIIIIISSSSFHLVCIFMCMTAICLFPFSLFIACRFVGSPFRRRFVYFDCLLRKRRRRRGMIIIIIMRTTFYTFILFPAMLLFFSFGFLLLFFGFLFFFRLSLFFRFLFFFGGRCSGLILTAIFFLFANVVDDSILLCGCSCRYFSQLIVILIHLSHTITTTTTG